MKTNDRTRWNEKYADRSALTLVEADDWLTESLLVIEADACSGRNAIDLACGLGHNAISLSKRGWSVDAIDISETGLELAKQSADACGARVNWVEADLDQWVPASGSADLVVVFRFLDRQSIPRIVTKALRPGGWLIYETFSIAQFDREDNQHSNRDFGLSPGELSGLFPAFDVVIDRNVALPDRTVDQFLARKPL